MKKVSKNYISMAIATLCGFAAAAQAQVTVFSENYEGYAPGTSELASWSDTSHISPALLTVASSAGVGGSQALLWNANFNGSYTGWMQAQMGYGGGAPNGPSGNTDPNPSDYTLTFDMAIYSGVGLNHMQLDIQTWSGGGFTGAMTDPGSETIDTSSVTVGGGYKQISVNLGTLFGSGFDAAAGTYQFQWQVNGWELAGGGPVVGEVIAVDNVQITMVPEPCTLALIGLGAAALFAIRRRKG